MATVHDGEGWTNNSTFKPVITKLLYTKFEVADQSFVDRFEQRFGYAPMLTASNAYDAINAVLHAYQNGAKTSTQIRAFITSNELDTATFGKARFAQDGKFPSKISIVEFESNPG